MTSREAANVWVKEWRETVDALRVSLASAEQALAASEDLVACSSEQWTDAYKRRIAKAGVARRDIRKLTRMWP